MAYILPDARASYRHWWENQTRRVWWDFPWQPYISVQEEVYRLYPHLRPPRTKRKRYKYTRQDGRRLSPWRLSTSGESRFVQSGYTSKEVSDVEQSRRDWRERKGFKRDHAKSGHRRHHNAGWYGKRMVHRARRQHEREMIAHERYDEISQGVQDVVRCWWD